MIALGFGFGLVLIVVGILGIQYHVLGVGDPETDDTLAFLAELRSLPETTVFDASVDVPRVRLRSVPVQRVPGRWS